uniref:Uncharacterized protein TCIL3000_11_1470 n=1 Tax=Trypanosoma congolense (strain IL3000) TaxID=1068625 RepID=G0UZE4_TRYCI|nr:unnamed protein product [Trypanosoma congolense IL3000]
MGTLRFPAVAAWWFLLTAPVVVLDAFFVLTRSDSRGMEHPFGKVWVLRPWTLYAKYDMRYAPNDDAFVVAQSWVNLLEVALGLAAVVLSAGRRTECALKVAVCVSVMTLGKTVLYFVMDVVEKGKYTNHVRWLDKVFMVIMPSLLWIAVPALIAFKCLQCLAPVALPVASVHMARKHA